MHIIKSVLWGIVIYFALIGLGNALSYLTIRSVDPVHAVNAINGSGYQSDLAPTINCH